MALQNDFKKCTYVTLSDHGRYRDSSIKKGEGGDLQQFVFSEKYKGKYKGNAKEFKAKYKAKYKENTNKI